MSYLDKSIPFDYGRKEKLITQEFKTHIEGDAIEFMEKVICFAWENDI